MWWSAIVVFVVIVVVFVVVFVAIFDVVLLDSSCVEEVVRSKEATMYTNSGQFMDVRRWIISSLKF